VTFEIFSKTEEFIANRTLATILQLPQKPLVKAGIITTPLFKLFENFTNGLPCP
jgi:hypothetical protein